MLSTPIQDKTFDLFYLGGNDVICISIPEDRSDLPCCSYSPSTSSLNLVRQRIPFDGHGVNSNMFSQSKMCFTMATNGYIYSYFSLVALTRKPQKLIVSKDFEVNNYWQKWDWRLLRVSRLPVEENRINKFRCCTLLSFILLNSLIFNSK